MTRIDDLTTLKAIKRCMIEERLRAIRQGSRSLALLASAAEVSIHENDHDAATELESVCRQIQAIQAEADAIQRELETI